MPKISVIIPVYNTADFLPRCLNSLCTQNLQDIEIVCVNDGSTDDSLSVLEKFAKKDKRIRIINSKENKGVSSARNRGISAAKGKYISFVDSDDYVDEDFLSKLYARAEETSADIVKGNYFYETDGYVAYWLNEKIKENKTNFAFDFCSAIYKIEFIKKHEIKFPLNLQDMEDPSFAFLAALYANKIETVDDAFVNVVKRASSLTYGVPNKERIKNKFAGLTHFVDLVNANSEKIPFDSYVFLIAFWLYNCYIGSTRNKKNENAQLVAKETLKILKNVQDKYYSAFKKEFENFGADFGKYLQKHNLPKELKEYNLLSEKHIIPIFLSSDETYAPFVATTIASVCYNTQSSVKFYVLDGGITNFSKKQIETLKNQFKNLDIEFIKIDIEKVFASIDYKNCCQHVSISTYNRFLIPELKPEIDKALYLDVDVIALGDIQELYNIELNSGYSLAACPEFIEDYRLYETSTRLKLKSNHKYFNAGVLLIDCAKWRKQNMYQKLMDIESSCRDICLQADQDVLNIAFDGEYQELPVKFNFMTNDILNKPLDTCIRHFNCQEKPWLCTEFENKPLINFSEFWFYASLTPFNEGLKQKFQTYQIKKSASETETKLVRFIHMYYKQLCSKSSYNDDLQFELPKNNGNNYDLLQALRTRVKNDNKKLLKK